MKNEIMIVPGFSFFGKNIGIKDNSLDFGGILSDIPCQAAGVFTRNTIPGAPVVVGKDHIRDGLLQAIIVNSKNANVATKWRGVEDAKRICRLIADVCHIPVEMVLPSSTGVIGEYLPMDRIINACRTVTEDFGRTEQHVVDFAKSIMTTDTHPKWVGANVGNASILGIAKGAGMIEPNMATMLCYFLTDGDIPPKELHYILKRAVDSSFNRISIDTDTSTSDTVVILSNGLAGPVNLTQFEDKLSEMAICLAKEIVRDGEGTTKLIELTVTGAVTGEQALLTAKSVINSPLVKAAIHGAGPNWGRFVMAIGKVFDYPINVEDLKLSFGQGDNKVEIEVGRTDQKDIPLAKISDTFKADEIYVEICLGKGSYSERVWGCDLTEEYVKANAYYTS